MTYLDGLKAAEAACHRVRESCLRDRRETQAAGDYPSVAFADAEAMAVSWCIKEIRTLILRAPR
jgi:hypothetical protein